MAYVLDLQFRSLELRKKDEMEYLLKSQSQYAQSKNPRT